jgi:two-component system, chemotaxis family, protein-glutamate methylesterase/glutaminase
VKVRTDRVELVAVGASLGGLLQLERLLSRLPKELPAAIALCQHRNDDTDSTLVRLLQKHSKLPVSEPEPLEPILPGRAYLAPAGYHLLVDDRTFSLSVDPPVNFARPSVDVLFESVADAYGRNAVGVILTSSSADGANGARAITRAGGKLAVQDPTTAESPVAPRATLERTRADFVGDTEHIVEVLIRWCL